MNYSKNKKRNIAILFILFLIVVLLVINRTYLIDNFSATVKQTRGM